MYSGFLSLLLKSKQNKKKGGKIMSLYIDGNVLLQNKITIPLFN